MWFAGAGADCGAVGGGADDGAEVVAGAAAGGAAGDAAPDRTVAGGAAAGAAKARGIALPRPITNPTNRPEVRKLSIMKVSRAPMERPYSAAVKQTKMAAVLWQKTSLGLAAVTAVLWFRGWVKATIGLSSANVHHQNVTIRSGFTGHRAILRVLAAHDGARALLADWESLTAFRSTSVERTISAMQFLRARSSRLPATASSTRPARLQCHRPEGKQSGVSATRRLVGAAVVDLQKHRVGTGAQLHPLRGRATAPAVHRKQSCSAVGTEREAVGLRTVAVLARHR